MEWVAELVEGEEGNSLKWVGEGEGPPLDGMLQRGKQEVINTYTYEWYVHDIVLMCVSSVETEQTHTHTHTHTYTHTHTHTHTHTYTHTYTHTHTHTHTHTYPPLRHLPIMLNIITNFIYVSRVRNTPSFPKGKGRKVCKLVPILKFN